MVYDKLPYRRVGDEILITHVHITHSYLHSVHYFSNKSQENAVVLVLARWLGLQLGCFEHFSSHQPSLFVQQLTALLLLGTLLIRIESQLVEIRSEVTHIVTNNGRCSEQINTI